MALFEFACERGHVTELLMKTPAQYTKCGICGRTAERKISMFAFTNSSDFNRQWHPEELNAAKDQEHWQKTHGKAVDDVSR